MSEGDIILGNREFGDEDIDKSPVMWAVAAILVGSLFYTVYKGNQEIESYKQGIKGTVISEARMPASASFLNKIESRYSSMDTPQGIKSVQAEGNGKKSIDSLIEKGMK